MRTSYADLKRLLSNLDLDAYFRALGLPPGHEVIVVEGEALRERNAMLAEYRLARHADVPPVGAAAADDRLPDAGLPRARHARSTACCTATMDRRPRAKLVARSGARRCSAIRCRSSTSRSTFRAETKRAVEDLVARVKAEFRARIETNTWLSPDTRGQALEKLDKVEIRVGYPSTVDRLLGASTSAATTTSATPCG